MILFYSFMLAFCSLVYEFVLSHLLAALLGGLLLRYTTTVALYITALGGGAYLVDKVFFKNTSKASLNQLVGALWRVELMLAFAGAVAPLLALMAASAPAFITQWVCYMLVCGVGLLSGFELPLLMRLGDRQRKGDGLRVLSLDFIGTCAGCVVFPLLLLPYLGVFYTAALTSSLNLVVAAALGWRLHRLSSTSVLSSTTRRGFWLWLSLAVLNMGVILLLLWPRMHNFMLERFYF